MLEVVKSKAVSFILSCPIWYSTLMIILRQFKSIFTVLDLKFFIKIDEQFCQMNRYCFCLEKTSSAKSLFLNNKMMLHITIDRQSRLLSNYTYFKTWWMFEKKFSRSKENIGKLIFSKLRCIPLVREMTL